MPFPNSVPLIADGQAVNAATTNGPLNALIQRTDWLKAQLAAVTSGQKLVLRAQVVAPGLLPGAPVFYNDTTLRFEPSQAGVTVNAYNTSTAASFFQGIAVNVSGTVADILLVGSETLTTVQWAAVIDTGLFSAGDYYLSDTDAGKLTKEAGSFGVYVGHIRADGSILLKATTGDTYLDHIHLQQTLLGKPAGTSPEPTIGNPQQITVTDLNQRGWLPKSAFLSAPYSFTDGVQIPAGTKFGYHIQHASEATLRAIFPPVPPESTTLVQGGLVLEPGVKFVVNNYGIWWLTDDYGTAPWPVDYATSSTAPNVYLWSVRIPGATNLADQLVNQTIQTLANGALAEIAPTGLVSGDNNLLQISGTEGDVSGWKGTVTLTNKGVLRAKVERGLSITATDGDSSLGYKGVITLATNTEFTAPLIHNTAGAKVVVSTNGYPSGTDLGLRADPLGGLSTDYIDYAISVGPNELPAATNYYVVPTLFVAVNVASPLVANNTFALELYRFGDTSALSTTNLIYSTNLTVPIGTAAGQLRILSMPANSSAQTLGSRYLVLRVKNAVSGTPLAAGVLRVLDVKYHMYKA